MKNKGFTLMEMAIVLAIIGILAAVLVPVTRGYIESAKNRAAEAGVNQVAAGMATAFSNMPVGAGWTAQQVFDNLHTNNYGGQYLNSAATTMGYTLQLSGNYYRVYKTGGTTTYYSSWQQIPY